MVSSKIVLLIFCTIPMEQMIYIPENFTVEQKEQIVIESFTGTNIAELCRRHVVSVAQFYRWKERFLECGRKGLGQSSRGNEYQKEVNDLKRLVGDQARCELYSCLIHNVVKKPFYQLFLSFLAVLQENNYYFFHYI